MECGVDGDPFGGVRQLESFLHILVMDADPCHRSSQGIQRKRLIRRKRIHMAVVIRPPYGFPVELVFQHRVCRRGGIRIIGRMYRYGIKLVIFPVHLRQIGIYLAAVI